MRPTFYNLPTLGAAMAWGGDVCEPKLDGRWVTIRIADGAAQLVSRRGRVNETLATPRDLRAVLCGEFLVGRPHSQRGHRHHGEIHVFDCTDFGALDIRHLPLSERRRTAQAVVAKLGAPFHLVPQFPVEQAPAQFLTDLNAGQLEGVVFKHSWRPYGHPWARFKVR